ncbi:MAG: OmpA family protein [Cytophagaceae bacterium]|nr:OmpA family protein [Cytophagaceae bacterium]MDW8455946.1 OmpA family protein [Cytophagaceae bacterium]
MKTIHILMLLFALITQHVSEGQTVPKEFKKAVSNGDKYFEVDDYHNALNQYLEADRLFPKDPDVSYKIAQCYHFLGHELKALPYLEIARNGGISDPEIHWLLGIAYHMAHQFDKAIASFKTYKSYVKPNDLVKLKQIDQRIQYCINGKEMVKNPKAKIKIKNLGPGVNSKYNDFAPVISADESILIFTSRRENTTGGQKEELTGEYFEDVYISVKSDTVWTTAVPIGSNINTPSHDACVGLSPDGQKLIIYRADKINKGDLYVSDLVGTIWGVPRDLGKNINTTAWEPHATISADEKTIIFTSDRKGGYGGSDIYMSKKLPNGEYGPPILLGPEINTEYDEDGPFLHPDGKTLYFSSKGHKSMGGFDIFHCTIDLETGKITSPVENVGYPINTADNDVFFVWSADNKRAYFSSEREGGYGEKDIYMLEREDADADLVVFKGKIISCDSKKPLAASIVVTDLTTQEPIGVYTSNISTGKYTVILPAGKNYGIAVEAQGYLFYSKNVDIPKLDHYLEMNDEICLSKLKVGTKLILRNIFFDVDKATLRKESEDELERLLKILKDNPNIKVELSGHTDSDGSDEHNMRLSEARAKAVVQYLLNKGIKADRLVAKGYGETQPQVPNDTPENKQLNRRTEIKILED